MKVDIDQFNNLRLREVFSGVLMETSEGNQIGVCMRDDTLEINVCPGGKNTGNWWRVNMQTGRIENMRDMTGGGGLSLQRRGAASVCPTPESPKPARAEGILRCVAQMIFKKVSQKDTQ